MIRGGPPNKMSAPPERPKNHIVSDLLKCPFCGAKAEYFQTEGHTAGHGDSSDEVGVKCAGCGNKFSIEDHAGYQINERKAEAKRLWNTRVYKMHLFDCDYRQRTLCKLKSTG